MKDLIVSKELFNVVTNSKCHEVFIKNEFIVAHSNLGMKMVNIYEFTFKCKEWANITKGKYLSSGYNEFDKKWEAMMMQYTFPADTELEAIFKACEWILKEQNNDTK